MLQSLVIAFVSVGLAAPAAAQITFEDPATTTNPAPSQKLKDPNRVICEKQDEMGTRLGGKKVCRTAAEWQEYRSRNKEQVDDWQRQLTNPGKPAG